jgi:hypothetical protein
MIKDIKIVLKQTKAGEPVDGLVWYVKGHMRFMIEIQIIREGSNEWEPILIDKERSAYE